MTISATSETLTATMPLWLDSRALSKPAGGVVAVRREEVPQPADASPIRRLIVVVVLVAVRVVVRVGRAASGSLGHWSGLARRSSRGPRTRRRPGSCGSASGCSSAASTRLRDSGPTTTTRTKATTASADGDEPVALGRARSVESTPSGHGQSTRTEPAMRPMSTAMHGVVIALQGEVQELREQRQADDRAEHEGDAG